MILQCGHAVPLDCQTEVVVLLFKKGEGVFQLQGFTLLSLSGRFYLGVLERKGCRIAVFVLDVEQRTSSTPSAGSSRVRGSLPNQSTCVLWIWRRHPTASLQEFCGGFSGIMECRAPLCGLPAPCKSDSLPVRAAHYRQFCLELLWTEFLGAARVLRGPVW